MISLLLLLHCGSSLQSSATPTYPSIVGGTTPTQHEFPFAAALGVKFNRAECSGVLVSPYWVLTAAHCRIRAGDAVVVGEVDLEESDFNGDVGETVIREVFVHPKYQGIPKGGEILWFLGKGDFFFFVRFCVEIFMGNLCEMV